MAFEMLAGRRVFEVDSAADSIATWNRVELIPDVLDWLDKYLGPVRR